MQGLGLIAGMAGLTLGSALLQAVLEASGKTKESQITNLVTIGLLVTTASTIVVKAIQAVKHIV